VARAQLAGFVPAQQGVLGQEAGVVAHLQLGLCVLGAAGK
jgi:hypothetical protein